MYYIEGLKKSMSPPLLSLNPSTTGNTIAMVNLDTPAPETTTQNNPSSFDDNIVPALDIDIDNDIDMENSLNAPAASTLVEPETGAPTQSRLSRTLPEEEQPIRSNQNKNGESTSVDQENIEHSGEYVFFGSNCVKKFRVKIFQSLKTKNEF